jgi:hypothetical protein
LAYITAGIYGSIAWLVSGGGKKDAKTEAK